MRIALTGNPNSGKTTMFNALTGRNEKVGNWAGVTVEKKEYRIKKTFANDMQITAIDLPGAYSMSAFTSEESITSSYIKNEKPDVIINIVDATNLSRSLFFTTQLLELGIPVVVALNKDDINNKNKTSIDSTLLCQKLNCPVIKTVSTEATGLKELISTAISVKDTIQQAPYKQSSEIDLTTKAVVEQEDRNRFNFVNEIVNQVERRAVSSNKQNKSDKIDDILTNKWLGIPIFMVVMFLVFDISQSSLGPLIADTLTAQIDSFKESVGVLIQNANPLLQALILDGIISGVGAVIGFLPLVMVMYFLIALLEDCGYMARVSVVLDPIFKKVGLSGKSVIPFVITTGCAIPGVMACRTIRDERERRATAMLAPFMPCGAKLPVIALFSSVFFANASWVGTLMYFVGILIIFFGAMLVNKITANKNKKSFFIMELPQYKIPSVSKAFMSMCSRGWAYIVKAATIILVCNTAVTLMQNFNWKFQLVSEGLENTSILASISTPFSILLIPLGFGVWQLAASSIAGFIAKENVVSTIAICYGITNFIDVENNILIAGAQEVATTLALTQVAALSCLMFNLFTPPCFAAMGAMNSEIKDKKWLWGGIALQFATGYTVSFFVYQIGTLITEKRLGVGFIPGAIAVSVIIAIITYLVAKAGKSADKNTISHVGA